MTTRMADRASPRRLARVLLLAGACVVLAASLGCNGGGSTKAKDAPDAQGKDVGPDSPKEGEAKSNDDPELKWARTIAEHFLNVTVAKNNKQVEGLLSKDYQKRAPQGPFSETQKSTKAGKSRARRWPPATRR